MTRDELQAEFNRIVAASLCVPASKRLDYVLAELDKLPLEEREFLLQLVSTTVALADERTDMKTIKLQLIASAACLLLGAVLAFCFKEPNGIQYLFMRGFFVLGFVGIAVAILVGTVRLEWSVTKSFIITATGGFALLIIIYYLNPPQPPDMKINPAPSNIKTNAP